MATLLVAGRWQQKSLTAKTADDAIKKWKVRQQAVPRLPEEVKADTRTMRGWLAWWIDHGRPNWRASTRRVAQNYIHGYVLKPGRWHNLKTADVRRQHIRDLLDEVQAAHPKLGSLSMHHLFSVLRVALKDAEDEGLIERNPARGMAHGFDVQPIERPIIQPGRATSQFLACCLSKTEEGKPRHEYGDALALLLLTAKRAIKVVATLSPASKGYRLRADRNEEWITPHIVRRLPKSKASIRTVPLSQLAFAIIENRRILGTELRKAEWEPALSPSYPGEIVAEVEDLETITGPEQWQPVFTAPRGGFITDVHYLSDTLRSVISDLLGSSEGFEIREDFHVHDLRGSFASRLISQKISVTAVASLLGHSSSQLLYTTYGHGTEPEIIEAISGDDGLAEAIGRHSFIED